MERLHHLAIKQNGAIVDDVLLKLTDTGKDNQCLFENEEINVDIQGLGNSKDESVAEHVLDDQP